MLGTLLLIVLILMLIGAVPTWPHSKNWGYAPSGGLGLIVIIIVMTLLDSFFSGGACEVFYAGSVASPK